MCNSRPFFNEGAISNNAEINWELISPLIFTLPPNNCFPFILIGGKCFVFIKEIFALFF